MQAFLADRSPDAYEKVVDRLLASPQYGERWGRHWMDIWRYSDWWGLGAELRNSQKHIWHWRDWIVESLNQDKGYDQMLREMLAADELYPDRRGRACAAPAFWPGITSCSTAPPGSMKRSSTPRKAFLGLTLNCCKCHDHKYDPFTQADYYRFRAIFEPYQIRIDNVPGETDLREGRHPACLRLPPRCADLSAHPRQRSERPDKKREIDAGLAELACCRRGLPIAPIMLPAEAYQPGLRPFVLQDHLQRPRSR